MNHQQYKEWLQLSLYHELSEEEQHDLNGHLGQCPHCREELEELKKLHHTLQFARPEEVTDQMLQEARQDLTGTLRAMRQRPSIWDSVSSLLSGFFASNYWVVPAGAAMLIAGIFLGRTVFPAAGPESAGSPAVQTESGNKLNTTFEGEPRITNFRFINSDASDGQLEFTFDAVSPVHIKGSMNDERVQKILAHALVNDQNPGVRLRSVSAFASNVRTMRQPDREVKASLIAALKSDGNPGVRREALRVLLGFPFDDETKQAFLFVLKHDTNSGLRIAAINSLDSLRTAGLASDSDVLDVLKERMNKDDNSYIRIRARAALQEGK